MSDKIKNKIYTIEKADNKTMLGKLNEIYYQFKALNISLDDIYNAIKSGHLKGDKGDKGEQGEQGVGVIGAELSPTSSNEVGITYDLEFDYTNGEKKSAGDILVPKGDKGDQGNGIEEIENGLPTVNGEFTYTPINVRFTDGTVQSFEIPAKNGATGKPMVNLDLVENVDFNNLTTTQTYYKTMGGSTNAPSNADGHATIYVNRGEEYENTFNHRTFCQLSQLWVGYNGDMQEVFYRDGYVETTAGANNVTWNDWKAQGNGKLYQHNIDICMGVMAGWTPYIYLTIINKSPVQFTISSFNDYASKCVTTNPDIRVSATGYISYDSPGTSWQDIEAIYFVKLDTGYIQLWATSRRETSGVINQNCGIITLGNRKITDTVIEL